MLAWACPRIHAHTCARVACLQLVPSAQSALLLPVLAMQLPLPKLLPLLLLAQSLCAGGSPSRLRRRRRRHRRRLRDPSRRHSRRCRARSCCRRSHGMLSVARASPQHQTASPRIRRAPTAPALTPTLVSPSSAAAAAASVRPEAEAAARDAAADRHRRLSWLMELGRNESPKASNRGATFTAAFGRAVARDGVGGERPRR
mmetsp:Transcript_42161/g.126243  ORF Transcript_42161/g.126243 Transcript_42161/m.126243 type:complete len:201 (+) Transcript_42161:938-1540(+)